MARLLQTLNLRRARQDYSHAVAPMQQLAKIHEDINLCKKVTWTFRDPECGQSTADSERKFDEQILAKEIESQLTDSDRNSPYPRKARVLDAAIRDIPIGRYQWLLFFVCGLGWAADNLWFGAVSLALPMLPLEFGVNDEQVRLASLCLNAGLSGGALFWSALSDKLGRKIPFNFTLLWAGVFGFAASRAANWTALCVYLAFIGMGVGGNLPVDGTMFMEFLAPSRSRLLVLMATWWPLGSLIAGSFAWPLMTKYSCEIDARPCRLASDGQPCCSAKFNMGWRYTFMAMSSLTLLFWVIRIALIRVIPDSPKSLLARGKQTQAVNVVHRIAHHNRTQTWLTEEILNEVGGISTTSIEDPAPSNFMRRLCAKFSIKKLYPFFKNRTQAVNNLLLWYAWTTIGMSYPLYNNFLAQYFAVGETSTNTIYSSYEIATVVGIFGPSAAYLLVNRPYLGRVRTMATAASIAGVFILLFAFRHDPDMRLGFSCVVAFFQNAMYAVLYAYTPESFPTAVRGTGTGVASGLNRVMGLGAPALAMSISNPTIPIYVSGALGFAAALAMVFLPIETRDKPAL